MCKAIDTAKFFLSLQTGDASDAISNMKLQKLLYYAQGFYLAMYDKELFKDDFEAWEHGPVIPSLYREFSKYGSSAIPKPKSFTFRPYTQEEKEFLREIYNAYGQFSAWALSEMTHQTLPWKNAKRNEIISKESMKAYFSTRIVED